MKFIIPTSAKAIASDISNHTQTHLVIAKISGVSKFLLN